MWKWSRIKIVVTSKISGALISIFVLGTILRLDNLANYINLDLLAPNSILNFLFPNFIEISSIGLAYLSSVLQFIVFIGYVIFSPRNVDITQSRFDYVNRSMTSLNANNVVRWIEEINREISENEVAYDTVHLAKIKRTTEYFRSQDIITSENFDNSIRDDIMTILQEKYSFLNNKYPLLRFILTATIIVSFGLGFVSALGAIIDNISLIF